MAKQSGLGNGFWLDGVDLSGDINRANRLQGGPGFIEQTAIDKSARERAGGTLTGDMEVVSFFNATAGQAHPTLDTLPRTDRIASYTTGTSLGSPAANVVAKQINYDPVREDNGQLLLTVAMESDAYGLDWGALATAGKRADTSATNGSGIDNAASSTFGLRAYLHLFAFTGTSVTVTLQHSTDNAVGDPYVAVTGGAFTAATAVGAQRIATTNALTIRRWLRVVTTGTFTVATFAVIVVRDTSTVTL